MTALPDVAVCSEPQLDRIGSGSCASTGRGGSTQPGWRQT